MDFIGRVSKTFSDTGKKTKDLADIARLNGKISDNNRKIKQLHTEIGELYCQEHGADAEEAFSSRVSEVQKLDVENKKWNEEIQKLRGMTKCPKCGNYCAGNAMYCTSCGQRLLPENVVVCQKCGSVVEKGTLFCQYCGARLPDTGTAAQDGTDSSAGIGADPDQEASSGEEPGAESDSASEDEQAPETRHCSNCGAELDPDAEFCPDCGTRVD
ncbi:MAG: zinc-ribbon domain-containing protein [Oscillospiraceae bacterium]|nr:zinc-ribbon domain-containing protein [Oscillospiraceae bacterium]